MSPNLRAFALTSCLFAAATARAELPAGAVEARGPATTPIGVIEAPSVSGDRFAIRGSVAYEGVEGAAYLELWSVLPDGSRYFSRTLAESGPMAKLIGSSGPREFVLPFFLEPAAPRPVRLEMNVVLPGRGHVTLANLAFASGDESMTTSGAWWSTEAGGLIGGVAGSAVGLLGAAVGILASMGRGRRFVLSALLALGVSGLLLLAGGVAALALGQPYEVWYPLLLMGLLGPGLGFGLLPVARRRFAAHATTGAR